MARYLIKRLVMAVIVLLLVMTFLAVLVRVIPGDPVTAILGPRADPALIAQVRHQLDLDQPVTTQIYDFMRNAFQGNLGTDILSQEPVTSLIGAALPHTLILAVSSLLLAIAVGIPLSVYGARRPNSWGDRITGVLSVSMITMPPYVSGLILLLVFSVTLNVLPAIGTGSLGDPIDYLRHLVLPTIALSLSWIGYIARLSRASMLEVLNTNYVRTAQAFGLKERLIFYKYVLKNAVIPVVAILGVGLGQLIGGAIFVEVIFARPGLGTLIYNAIQTRDYAIVRGGVLVIAIMFVLANFSRTSGTGSSIPGFASRPAERDGAMTVSAPAVDAVAAPRQRARPIAGLRAVARRPSGAFGLVVVGILLFLAVFGPLIAPYSDTAIDISARFQGPSLHHLLGTDQLGRDLLSRLIYGTRMSSASPFRRSRSRSLAG